MDVAFSYKLVVVVARLWSDNMQHMVSTKKNAALVSDSRLWGADPETIICSNEEGTG